MSDPNQTGDVFGAASRASDYIEEDTVGAERLDRRHQAIQGRSLRHVPARADRAVHPSGLPGGWDGAGPVRRQRDNWIGRCEAWPQRHSV